MEVGKAYIVHCGDWHTFVGRVDRQTGPSTYVFRAGTASQIEETNNGNCWNQIAAGDKKLRRAATYAHHETEITVPLSIAAIEWVGKTPAEEVA